MFDLLKDLDRYKGRPPYDSELYGVYQPILGWQSHLTRNWVEQGSAVDPRVSRVLDARIEPAPTSVEFVPARPSADGDSSAQYLAKPPSFGKFTSNLRVSVVRDLNSLFIREVCNVLRDYANDRYDVTADPPTDWQALLPKNADAWRKLLTDAKIDNILGIANDKLIGSGDPATVRDEAKAARCLQQMRFESQVAALLRGYVLGTNELRTERLNQIFYVVPPTSLDDIFRSRDPFEQIDPHALNGALSPIGLVHLYRQFFFDLGTFVGEPVEHVWLAPGTTIELYEVSTRKSTVERASESVLSRADTREASSRSTDELSSTIKAENEASTKFGVSSSNTANVFVYQGTLSTSLDLANVRKEGRETAHKQNRETSEKVASEIKQEFKTSFRMVTETTDTRSRRYVLENTEPRLINYELRRKMRRVGVQLQDIGTRLCWIVFVDDPGLSLGLPELVHVAESADLGALKEPEKLPAPVPLSSKVVVPLPFRPILDYTNNKATYEYQGIDRNGFELAIIKGDEDDDDSQVVIAFKGFRFDPPQTGYKLNRDIRVTGVQGGKMAVVRSITLNEDDGSFDIVLQRVNFGGENVVNLEVELHFDPLRTEIERVEKINAGLSQKYDEERRQAIRANYIQNVRARIQDARSVKPRDAMDLREEERTVVYRKLLERLMLDSWRVPQGLEQRRIAHLRSEVIRSLFDIDAMLYFVAPEWWVPRREQGRLNFTYPAQGADGGISLSEDDLVKWDGVDAARAANYKITEASAPAPLGSSLGWLIQLDGDNLRNAFLNAPWVKAVIPIRPGREMAGLNWLRSLDSAEKDGWGLDFVGTEQEKADLRSATHKDNPTVGDAVERLAQQLQTANGELKSVLQADRVYEHGFSHLASGFDGGLADDQVFDQWITVMPTDQIVAREYVETVFDDAAPPPPVPR